MREKSVLLVDDEPVILSSLRSYLVKHDLQVETAGSGETALELFRATPFDMVITDVVMEGMTGIDVLKEIKHLNAETCVLILTGRGDLALAIEALRAGADDFLLKPCDIDELILKMERFFEKQEAFKKIKIYEKFLPICMYCKRIRDDSGTEPGAGEWLRLEEFLRRRGGTDLTHGCCPKCFEERIGELLK